MVERISLFRRLLRSEWWRTLLLYGVAIVVLGASAALTPLLGSVQFEVPHFQLVGILVGVIAARAIWILMEHRLAKHVGLGLRVVQVIGTDEPLSAPTASSKVVVFQFGSRFEVQAAYFVLEDAPASGTAGELVVTSPC